MRGKIECLTLSVFLARRYVEFLGADKFRAKLRLGKQRFDDILRRLSIMHPYEVIQVSLLNSDIKRLWLKFDERLKTEYRVRQSEKGFNSCRSHIALDELSFILTYFTYDETHRYAERYGCTAGQLYNTWLSEGRRIVISSIKRKYCYYYNTVTKVIDEASHVPGVRCIPISDASNFNSKSYLAARRGALALEDVTRDWRMAFSMQMFVDGATTAEVAEIMSVSKGTAANWRSRMWQIADRIGKRHSRGDERLAAALAVALCGGKRLNWRHQQIALSCYTRPFHMGKLADLLTYDLVCYDVGKQVKHMEWFPEFEDLLDESSEYYLHGDYDEL